MRSVHQVTLLSHQASPRLVACTTYSSVLVAVVHLGLFLLLSGCAGGRIPSLAPGETFPTGEAQILSSSDTITLPIEIAASERLRRIGLSGRDHLRPDAGMLFIFDEEQPAGSGFWMYRTSIPLDLALVDHRGMILEILTMQPCTRRVAELCPRYTSNSPYVAALEVNAGYFGARGVRSGDRVRWEPD